MMLDDGQILEGLPLFPLPRVVLFPATLLPLHVFEPRYRAMLEAAMASDRLLGIVQLRPGWQDDYAGRPPLHEILGVGRVVRREPRDDGRSDILLRGLARARLLEELPLDEPFRRARVEVQAPRYLGSQAELDGRLATVRQLFGAILARIPGMDLDQADVLFRPEAPASVVLDSVASALPLSGPTRQDLLDELDPLRRADRLAAALAELATGGLSEGGPGDS